MCACVCLHDLAVNSSGESFSIALDSSFLKGLSGGSGLIVLGQANWPPLAATLSEAVLLAASPQTERFGPTGTLDRCPFTPRENLEAFVRLLEKSTKASFVVPN